MRYRKFGDSELETSVVGLWRLAHGQRALRLIRRRGGSARHRRLHRLGRNAVRHRPPSMAGARARNFLAGRSKAGATRLCLSARADASGTTPTIRRCGTVPKRALTKGLEESLQRLQTDYLDLYLIHWPDESRPMSRAYGGIRRVPAAGQDSLRRCQQLQRKPDGGLLGCLPHRYQSGRLSPLRLSS